MWKLEPPAKSSTPSATPSTTPPPLAKSGNTETSATRPPLSATSDSKLASSISIIGNDLKIMGERITIITKGTLQVDGEVHADLRGVDVVIGVGGKVTGAISAENVAVRGQVIGSIKAINVELLATSYVEGEIFQQTLMIEDGAHFEGRVRRPADPTELKPDLDSDQPSAQPKPAARPGMSPLRPIG